MDQSKIEAFGERILSEVNAGMSCFTMYLGHRLGLYQSLADAGPMTSSEMAGRTGYNERYLREWLEGQVVGGYLDWDDADGRFSLSPEHRSVLLDREGPAYAAPFLCFVPSIAGVIGPLMEAFRSGGGVPFEAYGEDALEAIADGNRPMFVHDLASKWIPAMPDIERRLQAGGRVLDVGCGEGWSAVSLAKGFPSARIDAVDVDATSIDKARHRAREAGVLDRIEFLRAPAEETPINGYRYDLVTAFECIHDMAYPVRALQRMHELVASDGAVLIADEAAGDTLEENRNFLGHLFYNFSVLHCLPVSMVFPESAGTGTVMRPSTLRRYAEEAGFRDMEVLPIENPFWRFYRLTP